MTAPRAVPPLAWRSDAELKMPGSKSVANRLLVAAALCGREIELRDVTPSDDVRVLVAGLQTLGFAVTFDEANERAVVGPRIAAATRRTPASGELFCGNAGTALRFLVSLAAVTPGDWTITGDAAMQRRPIGPLAQAWRQLGIDVTDANGRPPVRVRGRGDVRGGEVHVDASVSSQFVSSLLLVGAALPDGLDVALRGELASAEYVALTLYTLRRFGVVADPRGLGWRVEPGFGSAAAIEWVDGDWSSYGVWECLNHLTTSCVTGENLRIAYQVDQQLRDALRPFRGTGPCTIDAAALPDQFCNLVIVAAHRPGTTTFTDGANLRVKECDRIAVMARELTKLGADVEERTDGLLVRGGRPLRAGIVDPENDHRVAIAFALAGLLSPGIAIAHPECVAKSYPRFWEDLARVRTQRDHVAVVGMRGAGKSTFARAFAARTGVRCVDLDDEIEREHGPIAAFVATHGWPAFRAQEELFVQRRALRPESVTALGAGAIESPKTRALLRSNHTVWLVADLPTLRARLAAQPGRPSVTGAPVLDELPDLLARREPLYAELATVRVDATLPIEQQVDIALRALAAPCRWPGSSTPT